MKRRIATALALAGLVAAALAPVVEAGGKVFSVTHGGKVF